MLRVDVVHQIPPAVFLLVQPDGTGAVSAVPQAGMAFLAVRGLVIDEEHLRLGAGDLHLHFGPEGGLDHLPMNFRVRLPAVKESTAARPELAKIELIVPALVVELAQQFPAQGDAEGLGVSAAHLEHAVGEPLTADIAHQIVGGQPYPGGGEVPAPVLVSVAEAVLGSDDILLPIEAHPAGEGGLHPLGVPEHLKGVEGAEKFRRPIAHVIGHLLADGFKQLVFQLL